MLNIGFIGAGKIARALSKGFLAAGITKGEKLVASDPFPACLQEFQRLGGRAVADNCDVVKCSDVVFIAVKPTVVPAVLDELKPLIGTKHLVISIAMGVSIADIEKGLPPATRVVRMMPNTPVLVRCGASVFVCGSAVSSEDEAIAIRLLESVGLCYKVPESLINPITALSGSGPAYMYTVIEALADGAVKMGVPRDLAYRLTAQTLIGAGNMVLSTNTHPGQLKDDVASPAGSTAEGLHFLEKHGVRAAFIGAIETATERCQKTTTRTNEGIINE